MERSRDAASTGTASGSAAGCCKGVEGGTHAVAWPKDCPQTRFTPDEDDETREAGAAARVDRARTAGRAARDLQAGAVRGRIMVGGGGGRVVGGGNGGSEI